MRKTKLVLLYILILLQTNFLYVIPFPDWFYQLNSYTAKYLSLGLIIVLGILSITNLGVLFHKRVTFLVTICLAMIVTVFLIFKSSSIYNQTLSNTFNSTHQIFVLLLFIVLWMMNLDKQDTSKIVEFLINIGTWAAGLVLVQGLIYNQGFYFIPTNGLNLTVGQPSFLFGLPRISMPADFVSFSVLLICVKWISVQKLSKNDFIKLIIQIVYVVLVSQTRMYMIICAGIVVVSWLFLRLQNNSFIGSIAVIGIIGVVAIILGPLYNSFTSGDRSMSFIARTQAYRFYMSEMPKFPFIGIGFPNDQQVNILHGGIINVLGYQYYLDDLGVFGFYVQYGILGLIVLLGLLTGTVKQIILNLKNNKSLGVVILIAFYLGITSVSLSLLNPQRIFFLTIAIFLISINFKYQTNNNQESEDR